jgi:hypothetical protein
MYAFSWDVLRPCVRHTAKQYSKTSPHTPLSLLLGARGVSLRRSSGLFSGDRQHETQCSKLSQQLSSLLHLRCTNARSQNQQEAPARINGQVRSEDKSEKYGMRHTTMPVCATRWICAARLACA